MKKKKLRTYFSTAIIGSCCLFTTSCSKSDKDEDSVLKPEGVSIQIPANGFNVDRCKTLILTPMVSNDNNLTYEWVIGDSILSTEKELRFISVNTGSFDVILKVKQNLVQVSDTVTVIVNQEETAYSPELSKVIDFMPAPGQFGNVLPVYVAGDTQETMNKKAEESLLAKELVSLGAYGGYVVVGFDHTIVNVPGSKDFKVLGNAFYAAANPNPDAPKGGSCEPGIVEVAYDKNENGKPDDDEWYELAGSEYAKSTAIKNYEITYYKPDENKTPTPNTSIAATDTTYCRWKDNQGKSGYVFKNSFHKQAYYPQWAGEKITFKGTLLPNNAVDESGTGTYWVLYAYDWGYADNAPNNGDLSSMDIDWAVDKDGNKVHLPGVDFVKIYTGVQQYAGWLGDTSTEVAGVTDLHISTSK